MGPDDNSHVSLLVKNRFMSLLTYGGACEEIGFQYRNSPAQPSRTSCDN
jgi:hypothetical protein